MEVSKARDVVGRMEWDVGRAVEVGGDVDGVQGGSGHA